MHIIKIVRGVPVAKIMGLISVLERQPHRELADARRRTTKASGGCNLTKRRTIDVSGPVEDGGLCELRMIQDVEILHTKFQAGALGVVLASATSKFVRCGPRSTLRARP